MDPLSLALGAAGVGLAGLALFEPAVKACFEIWGFYQLSQNYGIDYRRILRAYRLQITRTASMMTEKTSNLVKIPGSNTPEAIAILDALAGIKSGIKICEDLMEKHGEPLGPRFTAQRQNQHVQAESSDTQLTSAIQSSLQEDPIVEKKKPRRFPNWLLKRKVKATSSSASSGLGSQLTREDTKSSTPASSISEPQKYDLSGQTAQMAQDQLARYSFNGQNNLKSKGKWIMSEKQEFEEAVKEILSLNDFLQNTLMIKYVTGTDNHDMNLIDLNPWDRLEPDQAQRKSHMEYLHRTFQSVNGVGGKLVRLSIPLRNERSHVLDDGLVNLSGKKMNPGGTKYIFHANQGSQSSETAKLIIVEFRFPEFDLNKEFVATVPSLNELPHEIKNVSRDASPPLQYLGKFDGNENNPPVIVYQDVSKQFRKVGNLMQELQDQTWRARDLQIYHIGLARTVAETFLVLENTLASSLPRTSDFVNYSTASTESKGNGARSEDGDPYSSSDSEKYAQPAKNPSKLSALYLTSSFGAADIQDISSLLRIAQDGSPNIVVALGLILYQIGCWKSVKYKMNAHSLELARSNALDHLIDVDRYLPGQYTRAVEACLRWTEDEFRGPSTTNMLKRLVVSLRTYETDLRRRF